MMNKKNIVGLFVCLSALLFLFFGCLQGGDRVAVEKRYFAIDVSRPGEEVSSSKKGVVLRVQKFRVSARYRGKGLIYRTDEDSYESDFYNEFFVPPGPMIAENVHDWLSKSGLFQNIVKSSSRAESTYVLEGVVLPIYGDYRNTKAPKAVLGIEFFVINDASSLSDIVFQKRYLKKVPLKEKSPDGLVKGWNEALKQILVDFEKDLQETNLNAKI
ncbi:MAG TPA: hypothetical protein VMW81_02905 [Nitrospinota bacterium]|nr:hypothetical protein [Nitrospinota bacterium]